MTHPYASEYYARAFEPSYIPIQLPESQLWMLSRPIPDSTYRDAMACYPTFPLPSHLEFKSDFNGLAEQGLVSIVLVTDVFFGASEDQLMTQFDFVRPYKKHYIRTFRDKLGGRDAADHRLNLSFSKHHRLEVQRSRNSVETRFINLVDYLDDWLTLYSCLTARHNINGVQQFSPRYFAALTNIPGFKMVGAFSGGRLVSGHLWLEYGGYAYSHLSASNNEGYRLRASYAVYDTALRYFADRVRAVDLGGIPDGNHYTGLDFFKRGFANADLVAFLAGAARRPGRRPLIQRSCPCS